MSIVYSKIRIEIRPSKKTHDWDIFSALMTGLNQLNIFAQQKHTCMRTTWERQHPVPHAPKGHTKPMAHKTQRHVVDLIQLLECADKTKEWAIVISNY